jgi:hypothetical protein
MSIANLPPIQGAIVVDSGVFDEFVELASGADLIFKSPSGLAETTMEQLNNTQFLVVNAGDGTAVSSEIIFQAKNSAGVNKQILAIDGDNAVVGGILYINSTGVAGQYAKINTSSGNTDVVSDTRFSAVPLTSAVRLFATDAVQALVPVLVGTPTLVTIDPQLNCSNGLSVTGNMSCTGTLSSGDVPVLAGWAFQTVPSSTLTTIYTSPDLPNGVYLITACVQVSTPTAGVVLDAVNVYFLDEGSNQVPAGFATYNGTAFVSTITTYTTSVTTFLRVTSTSNNFFTIKINCKSSDNLPYELTAQGTGLGDGGVHYMKIA